MLRLSALALALALAPGCSTTEDTALPTVAGLAVAESDASVAGSFDRLTDALEAAPPVGVVAEVDHSDNAASVGLNLRPTRVVLFGNPALGTPLMQANPVAGLDLPQNVLVYQGADGQTVVGYNTVEYLARRHGVGGVATLDQIESALAMFATVAAAGEGEARIETTPAVNVARGQGIVTVASPDDVETTYGRLKSAIEANDDLTIVAELDHQANAARVDLELPPIRLIVFGNPALGTPLMQASQTAGIDLPQKMLVYQDAAGDAFVAYNAPSFLAARHGLGSLDELDAIANALATLAGVAAGDSD